MVSRPWIRRAAADDAPLVAALGARIFIETFGDANARQDIDAYVGGAFDVDRVRQEIVDPQSRVFIVEIDGHPAGFARLHAGDAPASVSAARPVELVRLYVERAQHGTGIGAKLMEHCLEEARSGGYDVMHLGVWEHNQRAIAFYRKYGFERVGQHTFMLGSDAQTDWNMALRLE